MQNNSNSAYYNLYLDNTDTTNIEYKNCNPTCLTCEDGDGLHCIKCAEGYVFYEGGDQKCVEKATFFNSIANENYYFNEILQEFRLCHSSCNSCKDGNVYNNCYECNTNPDYVFLEDESSGNCVLKSLFEKELKNYYPVTVNNQKRDGTPTSVVVYKKCPENCDECEDPIEENPLKCKVCSNDKGYYKTLADGTNRPFYNHLQEECTTNTINDHYFFDGNHYSSSLS